MDRDCKLAPALTTRLLNYLLAALSGLLLALSFPKFGHPAFGWVALAPLLVAVYRQPLRRGFAFGLTAGAIYFTGTIYWITNVMVRYGGLNAIAAVLVNAALIAYMALFPALFALIVARLTVRGGARALWLAPMVWVATEYGRAYLFSGFPWVLLGYSQASVLPVAQLASLLGVFGVSALVAAVSAAMAYAAVGRAPSVTVQTGQARVTARPLERFAPLGVVLLIVLSVALWGSRRIARGDLTRAGDAIRVGLIQGNVDQAEKWDDARASSIFANYLRMTRQAIAEGAQVVLWPESSTPFYFEEDRGSADQVRRIAREAHVPILLGSDQIEHGKPTLYYNSAFLVAPDGSSAGVYRKMHLVPFGEYVPLKRVLFFAAPLVEAVSDFSPGEAAVLLPVKGHLLSTAICYEIVYPALVRQFTRAGSELLTTITNDAWFGDTSAPYQHFAQAAMRAIENGRYLVRSANTGISGIVDPYGRVLAESRIYEPAVIVGEARFIKETTFYTRHGDAFAYAATVATLVMLVLAWRSVQSRNAYR
jgi:apolipoprotein N-acyltransferase